MPPVKHSGKSSSVKSKWARSRIEAVVVIVLVTLIGICFHEWIHSQTRITTRRSACSHRLRYLGRALTNYHAINGSYPPAVYTDKEGQPLYSWRLPLITFLDETPRYEKFRLDEPWDSDHNGPWSDMVCGVYTCWYHEYQNQTDYLAVVGENTAWRGATPVSQKEITDDPHTTILLVEAFDSGINWAEPRDLLATQMAEGVNSGSGLGIRSPHPEKGANVLFVNGRVSFMSNETSPEVIQAMLTINGGEEIIEEPLGVFRLKAGTAGD